jgi:hypothetical protein
MECRLRHPSSDYIGCPRNKQKQFCWNRHSFSIGCFLVCFAKIKKFRFVSICFRISDLQYINTTQPKQTKPFRNKSKKIEKNCGSCRQTPPGAAQKLLKADMYRCTSGAAKHLLGQQRMLKSRHVHGQHSLSRTKTARAEQSVVEQTHSGQHRLL